MVDEVTVEKCPICGGTHRFGLAIHYSQVASLVTSSTLTRSQQRVRSFQIRFMCPVKKTLFDAEIQLTESDRLPIESVEPANE